MLILFKYIGRDQKGHKVTGDFKANTTDEVIAYLAKRHIVPVEITSYEKHPAKTLQSIKSTFRRKKIPLPELLDFCHEMTALIGVGISILDAIKQLASSSPSPFFSDTLSDIAEELTAGKTLANALRKYPIIFTTIFTNIIEVGENTGNLSESFAQLGNYIENVITNRRRLASTIRYPLSVLIISIMAAITINIVVVPKFSQIFQHFGGELPIATRILIAFSNFLISYWKILAVLMIIIIICTPYLLKKPKILYVWDKYKLRFPIFGKIQKRILVAQFTWTFSLTLRSGIEVIKGITLAGNAAGNAYFTQQILSMRDGLERGESLSASANSISIFPPAILQMIAVGEESGKLEDILQSVNKYYEKEIDYDIRRINELIEPMLLVVVGIIVLTLALGVYLPLWDLVKVVKFT
jgi:MSHA biogenesis protein MshG